MQVIITFLLLFALLVSQSVVVRARNSQLKIGAFNIQVFGQSKTRDAFVMSILVKILRRYDIVSVMEIRDADEVAVYTLLDAINYRLRNRYAVIVSSRLGRTDSKEQYAVFYKISKVNVTNTRQFKDLNDTFERPPFSVRVRPLMELRHLKDFALLTTHITPRKADAEIRSLAYPIMDVLLAWPGVEGIIVAGDLNADCKYLSNRRQRNLKKLLQGLTWYIDGDTTLSKSNCSYDRFLVGGAAVNTSVSNTAVFRFDQEYGIEDNNLAKNVSDHYPIDMLLK